MLDPLIFLVYFTVFTFFQLPLSILNSFSMRLNLISIIINTLTSIFKIICRPLGLSRIINC